MSRDWRIEDTSNGSVLRGPGYERVLPYTRTFLEALAAHRSDPELVDELLRSEHPPYIEDRLRVLLRGHDVGKWRVLDFGCGAGASAVCLARLGVPRIVGVDIVNDYAKIWRHRLAEAGFPQIGHFVQSGDTGALPFRDEQFDAAFLNGLVEHLLPEERVTVLREVFRTIRRGGVLFVTETPNSWFPRNSHTKLWGSEWLPLRTASRLARRYGPRSDFPTADRTAMYRTGMRGSSIRAIHRVLGSSARRLAVSTDLVEMEFSLPRNPMQSTAGKQSTGRRASQWVRLASRIPGLDVHAFSPHLNLAFRKR